MSEQPTANEQFGCHCDLDPGMRPDDCVLDYGQPSECVHAMRLVSEGKNKWHCIEWRKVEETSV